MMQTDIEQLIEEKKDTQFFIEPQHGPGKYWSFCRVGNASFIHEGPKYGVVCWEYGINQLARKAVEGC